jgi:hypothetical protein
MGERFSLEAARILVPRLLERVSDARLKEPARQLRALRRLPESSELWQRLWTVSERACDACGERQSGACLLRCTAVRDAATSAVHMRRAFQFSDAEWPEDGHLPALSLFELYDRAVDFGIERSEIVDFSVRLLEELVEYERSLVWEGPKEHVHPLLDLFLLGVERWATREERARLRAIDLTGSDRWSPRQLAYTLQLGWLRVVAPRLLGTSSFARRWRHGLSRAPAEVPEPAGNDWIGQLQERKILPVCSHVSCQEEEERLRESVSGFGLLWDAAEGRDRNRIEISGEVEWMLAKRSDVPSRELLRAALKALEPFRP